MELTIGSNGLRRTDGIINVRGRRQIMLEWGPIDSELLLTMDLYGADARHIARLRRNQWTFNDRDRFTFATGARRFSLVDTKTSRVVLEARVVRGDSVVITQGAFFSFAGHQIEITTEDWDGLADSRAPSEPVIQTTNPPFAADEIAVIRKAVMSSKETIECPRCGWPLTRQRLNGAPRLDTHMVSCVMCRRNLVVHG